MKLKKIVIDTISNNRQFFRNKSNSHKLTTSGRGVTANCNK